MKTVMVTGSNVGLGKEAARQLASIDGVEKVLLACRNQQKAEAAKEDLEKTTGKKIYEVVVLDTCDLASVRKAVASIETTIDGLIMNAGGPLGVELTSDGVTTSFAANVLGHVVLTEELIKAGKLSGSVVYVSSEAVRGIPKMGLKRVPLNDHSVQAFKKVADGSFILEEYKSSDARMDTYGIVKYMGTLWTSYMARQHPEIRFVSISPGASQGTNATSNLGTTSKIFFKVVMKVFALFGGAHGAKEGAKRYIDGLTDASSTTFQTGEFYASKKGASGPMVPQSESNPSIADYKDPKIQDNVAQAIHDIINQKDFENKATNKPNNKAEQATTAAF